MPDSVKSPRGIICSLAAVLTLAACTDRQQQGSDLGRDLASRLCPIQAECGCDEELLIPRCERQVEREFLKTERVALERGFVLDPECMDQFLAYLDGLGTCERLGPDDSPRCPVYTANAEAGEPCDYVGIVPLMMDCRPGLWCVENVCRDLRNRPILAEGEICSDTQSGVPTGFLGQCDEGLTCDANNTRTCIPSPYWPEVPVGEECPDLLLCEGGSYCRPQGTAPEDISEDAPGICTLPTEPGEPCTYVHECATFCDEDAGVCQLRPIGLCSVLDSWWLAPTLL